MRPTVCRKIGARPLLTVKIPDYYNTYMSRHTFLVFGGESSTTDIRLA